MEETEHCPVQLPLRQGDILKIESGEGAGYHFSLAAIINADCDMANEKHDGVIAVLPIYRFTEYLQKFWLPTFAGNHISNASKIIRESCELDERSTQELIRWITSLDEHVSFDVEKLASRFSLGRREQQLVSDAIARLRLATSGLESGSLACVKNLAPNPKNSDKYIQDQIADAKKALGDGHFFITDLKGDDGIGFVVRMRRIYSIDASRCFSSYSALQSSGLDGKEGAYRLSRLTPHYKFRLAQIFAQQFSRIGLPDELMALSGLAVDNAVQHVKSLKQ